ncbi:SusD-like starch-binding protein associating with outer membrane [Chitinophaga polysaccharea]|uniref:SusD-like starch-binding protein associating with outer membrane n=1 Tax=Chitinophaga polysaccharea TaxID=1293035 RepID=A0A561P3Z6_9BACT|nr:RagB/SusD family nutrient uptake outer membrane protein [Chitinophaga polysaccharea]TWF32836.1 SusD-like starch-binding protein associating with outer membrane [Chitinophaga polysaccharea]
MKKLIVILSLGASMISCKKFLDIKPQTQVDRDELFNSEQGFKEALNGIYTLCASQSLYGGQLTYNMLDVLGQNYTFSDVTNQDIANFVYTGGAVKGMVNDVWGNAYKAIANCNYLLQAIDKDTTLFSSGNYRLIKGETLALRAYLHFDMLRLFAPSYVNGATQKGIPYVTRVGTTSTPFSPVNAALDSVLRDLNTAKNLLQNDPIRNAAYTVGYPGDDKATELKNADLFMQNRRHRLNYYAVCGELSRVYLYRNDYNNALNNAVEVISSAKFPFTRQEDFFQTDIQLRDRIFYKELIGCWYTETQSIIESLQARFTQQNPAYSGTADQVNDIYEIGTVGAEDWRLKQWFLNTASTTGGPDRAVLQKYYRNAQPLTNIHPLVAPAIRLSELYYIAAEASYDKDPQRALNYYNQVRAARGIGYQVSSVASKAAFIDLLVKEARKEFYGESQIFFMYKRLHHAVTINATNSRQPSNSIFVLPLPDDENAYRNN